MLKGDSIAITFEEGAKERALALLKDAPFAKEVLDEEEGVRVYVDNGGETVASLISLLAQDGIRVQAVTLARPTLDDVFIKFTGRSMDKVEEKVRPWWAQWAGDNWEQAEAQGDWKGNKWMNADGTPKDKEAFEAWTQSQGAAEGEAAGEATVEAPAGVSGNGRHALDDVEDDVSEEKKDEAKPETGASEGTGWAGNEWVNADGTPKDPEAMAKWLKETGASKGSK
jgi:hypothetical protein